MMRVVPPSPSLRTPFTGTGHLVLTDLTSPAPPPPPWQAGPGHRGLPGDDQTDPPPNAPSTPPLQALATVDRLVMTELGKFNTILNNTHERSDAMLAIYPGHGARFAR